MVMLLMASLVITALLYAPGYLFFKAIRFPNIMALVLAPIASAGAYGLLPVIYAKLGIYCTVYNVVLAPTAVFAIALAASWGLSRVRRDAKPDKRDFKPARKGDWLVLGLYLACGIAVCLISFVAVLGSPEAFFSRYDNQTHLNMAQSFADSGTWSALDHSRYGSNAPNQNPFASKSGGFYPVTWHVIVALTCLVTGAKVTVASNALVAVLAALVFPAGMFALMRALFPDNRAALVAGAFATVSFATYPWIFPLKGPTLPNMLGYALMPAAMGTLIAYLEEGLLRAHVVQFCLFGIMSFVSLAIAHTSALFTAFVFLAAYGGHYINAHVRDSQRIPAERRALARGGALAAYILLIIGFWAFCLTSPIFASVVSYSHVEDHSAAWALFRLVLLRLEEFSAQYAMAAVSLIGIVTCIRRRIFWILIPVAYMCIGYMVSRTGFEPFLTIFMALWYELPYRASTCLSIYLMPVAAIGLSAIWQWVKNFATAHCAKAPLLGSRPALASGLVMVVLALATFMPLHIPNTMFKNSLGTPFSSVYEQLGEIYAQDENRVYGAEEVAFVDKAMGLMPEGALVVNSPQDGSLFSYGVNHLNAYYRATSLKNQTDESKALSRHLYEYASNPEVQKAVRETGAQYVLQLDQGVSYEDLIKLPQYHEQGTKNWVGIDRIRDDTPGFTVVLSEGDMRLLRIDELEGA